jgi:thioredoxin reductase
MLPLGTSLPGVFAAGDIHHGSSNASPGDLLMPQSAGAVAVLWAPGAATDTSAPLSRYVSCLALVTA